jgi:ABC-2 type transport system permease protein
MTNILAVAHKELKSYFASPIAYVLLGVFAVLYGWFFAAILLFFERQSMQMGAMGMGPQSVNINQQLIRPVLMNVSVIMLFVLPLITMRSYAEEKRSGTIELLLTSPLTDVQIVLGKFLGAMGLIAAMLAVTLPHLGLLSLYSDPEWRPLFLAYLGYLLMTGCFVSVGLFISSLTRNQIVAAVATFGVFLMLWVVDWMSTFAETPVRKAVYEYLSITGHFDDFTKGVLDTKHLVYYLSFIAFGLFLTVRSVDSERWRG